MKVSTTGFVPSLRVNPFGIRAGESVRRRVDSVQKSSLIVDGVVLPKTLLPSAKVGQWVQVSLKNGALNLKVDLKATLIQESRLNDLFVALTR
jgi:hypothetical protein